MPKPHTLRDRCLKQLRGSFPHKLDLVIPVVDDEGNPVDGVQPDVFPYEDVKAAIKVIIENGPHFYKVLHMYMFTPLSRTRIAEELSMDPSTMKRRLDVCADRIMQILRHGPELSPPDLYTIFGLEKRPDGKGGYNEMYVPTGTAAYPCTYPHADRNNF